MKADEFGIVLFYFLFERTMDVHESETSAF